MADYTTLKTMANAIKNETSASANTATRVGTTALYTINAVESLDNVVAGKVSEAPQNGRQYARKDGTWVVVSGGGGGGTSLNYYSEDTSNESATIEASSAEVKNSDCGLYVDDSVRIEYGDTKVEASSDTISLNANIANYNGSEIVNDDTLDNALANTKGRNARQSFTATAVTLEACTEDYDWYCLYQNPLTSLTLTFGNGKGEHVLKFTCGTGFTASIADCTIIGDSLSFEAGKTYVMSIFNKTIVMAEATEYTNG